MRETKKYVVRIDNETRKFPATPQGERDAYETALLMDNGLHAVSITDQDGVRMQLAYLRRAIEYVDYRDKQSYSIC